MLNGDDNYSLGREIGGLRSDVQNLAGKIDNLVRITEAQENKINAHEQWIETHKGVAASKYSALQWLIGIMVVIGSIMGFISTIAGVFKK